MMQTKRHACVVLGTLRDADSLLTLLTRTGSLRIKFDQCTSVPPGSVGACSPGPPQRKTAQENVPQCAHFLSFASASSAEITATDAQGADTPLR